MPVSTKLPYNTRPAGAEDAGLIHRIYQENPGYFRLIGAEVPSEADTKSELLAALKDKNRRVEIIYLAGEAVGLLDYKLHHPEKDAATLSLVLISERYRGLGLGKLAVLGLEEALAREFATLYAAVYGENPKAEKFFTSLGYRFERSGGPAVKWFSKPLRGGP